MQTVDKILNLARKHVGNGAAMESSARLCLERAIQAYDAGQIDVAITQGVRSLDYSIGLFHPDRKHVARLMDGLERTKVNA